MLPWAQALLSGMPWFGVVYHYGRATAPDGRVRVLRYAIGRWSYAYAATCVCNPVVASPPGPTVAFYFLWLEFYTRALITPCLLGAGVELVSAVLDVEQEVVNGVKLDHLVIFGCVLPPLCAVYSIPTPPTLTLAGRYA